MPSYTAPEPALQMPDGANYFATVHDEAGALTIVPVKLHYEDGGPWGVWPPGVTPTVTNYAIASTPGNFVIAVGANVLLTISSDGGALNGLGKPASDREMAYAIRQLAKEFARADSRVLDPVSEVVSHVQTQPEGGE